MQGKGQDGGALCAINQSAKMQGDMACGRLNMYDWVLSLFTKSAQHKGANLNLISST